MTSVEAVEISLEECRRYMVRAEIAAARLRRGEDNNKDTAAMKRASYELSNSLVPVRNRPFGAKKRNGKKLPSIEEIRQEVEEYKHETVSGAHPDQNQFLCSECSGPVDLHKIIPPGLTSGEKVCESCFHSNAYQSRKAEIREQKQPETEQKPCPAEQNPGPIKQSSCKEEQRPSKWKNIPGSSNGQYRCLADEMIEVRYGSCVPIKIAWAETWELVDCKGSTTDAIKQLLGDIRTNNKVTAVRSFVKAVKAGKIPEAPAGDE